MPLPFPFPRVWQADLNCPVTPDRKTNVMETNRSILSQFGASSSGLLTRVNSDMDGFHARQTELAAADVARIDEHRSKTNKVSAP